jgi:hypothetical protein
MSFSGIKMGRIPKAEKERALKSLESQQSIEYSHFNHKSANNGDEDGDSMGDNEDLSYNSSSNSSSALALLNNRKTTTFSNAIARRSKQNNKNNKQSNNQLNSFNASESIEESISNSSDNSFSDYATNSMNNFNNFYNNEMAFFQSLNNSIDENMHRKPAYLDQTQIKFSKDYCKQFKNQVINHLLSSSNTAIASNDSDKQNHKSNGFMNHHHQQHESGDSNAALETDDYIFKFFELIEFHKDDFEKLNKKRPFVLNNRKIAFKNKSSEILVKNILNGQLSIKATDLLPNTFYSNLFISAFLPCEPSCQVIFSLLNDKIYQIYLEHSEETYKAYDRVRKNLEDYDRFEQVIKLNNRSNPDDVVNSIFESMPLVVESAIKFGKEVPGLNELNSKDFANIVNLKIFDFFMIINSILFINDESYLSLLNGYMYTRFWMNSIKGKHIVDDLFEFMEIFNSLNLTKKEKGLLIALIFTMSGK